MGESPKREVGFFGSRTRSNVLLLVYMMEETYPTQIAKLLGVSLNQVQMAIESLSRAGMIIEHVEGRQRRVSLNSRSVFAEELRVLLAKQALYATELQDALASVRRRPRRTGKEL